MLINKCKCGQKYQLSFQEVKQRQGKQLSLCPACWEKLVKAATHK